jgi:hypothetical protein
MHILLKLSSNNKLQIKQYRLADGFFRKRGGGDTAKEKGLEKIGKLACQAEAYLNYLCSSREIKSYELTNRREGYLNLEQGHSKAVLAEELVQVDYCQLPPRQLISIVNEHSQEVEVIEADYHEVQALYLQALDLLKKSQYSPKKERPWGKEQKPKVFRYQAAEKIKEGGAIIDRFVGAKNSHMITLTLPGSTPEAMNALSRWSGWIVNRLLQVIRNRKKDYKNMYWFFVWEHQKRGALHLHFCLGWRTFWLKREVLAQKIKDKFYELLFEIGEREEIDMFERKNGDRSWKNTPDKWQFDIQKVKKSVAAYFAKYCQKNSENQANNGNKPHENRRGNGFQEQSNNSKETNLYPSRYWGSSRTIKQWNKFLSKQFKITFDSEFKASDYLGNIREKIGEIFSFKGVYSNPFQIEDKVSKRVIVSGVVESYVLHPCDFVDFWTYCMDVIIGREPEDQELFDRFLASAS